MVILKIKPHGSFFEISEDGYICNMGHPDRISQPWKELVETIKQIYVENCADQLHSIYVRGSVARGLAIPNISDVDSFAVTKPGLTIKNIPWVESVSNKLLNDYPFTTGIEFGVVSYEETLARGSPTSIVLKTQSVCLYGDDLQYQIQPYKPNREVIDQAFFLAQKIERYEQETALEKESTNLKAWCTWTMKGIVRSGFELVIEEEQTYTRDLYLCYTTFISHYPDKKEQMYQALKWAINPISDYRKILSFLQEFGRWLCQQIEIRYPLNLG